MEFSPISLISNKWTAPQKQKTKSNGVDPLLRISLYLYIHMCVFVSIFIFHLFWGNLWRICSHMCPTIFQILSLRKNLWDWLQKDEVPCCHSFSLQIQFKTFLFPMGLNGKMAGWKLSKIIHLLAQVALFNHPKMQNDNNQVGDPIAIPIQQHYRSHQKLKHLF